MQKLLAMVIALSSLPSFGMTTQTIQEMKESELTTSYLVTMPAMGTDVLIEERSDENGVCRALGFERAAVGTMMKGNGSYNGFLVQINDKGEITNGSHSTNKLTDLMEVTSIVCINKISMPKELARIVDEPRHYNSLVPFSSHSYSNGICKALGYSRGAPGASYDTVDYNGPVVEVGEDGRITGGDVSPLTAYAIKSIVCVEAD